MSYSLDLRRKVLAIKKEKGLSIRETAKHFCIGSATVSRWIKQIEPKPAASRSRKIDKSALEKDVRQSRVSHKTNLGTPIKHGCAQQ